MDDVEKIAQQALDCAKSAQHRCDKLEADVSDLRDLTVSVGNIATRMGVVEKNVEEIKTDVKCITSRPGKLQDKLIAATLTALSVGLVTAVLALILK